MQMCLPSLNDACYFINMILFDDINFQMHVLLPVWSIFISQKQLQFQHVKN
jgi:hypothetical protein